jgi:hypothetical protein
VTHAGYGAVEHVAYGEHVRAALLGRLDRRPGVQRLAGLADGNDQIARRENRFAVACLAGKFGVRRYARQLFDPVTTTERGVITGAAGEEHHAIDVPRDFAVQPEFGVDDIAGFEQHAAAQRILDRARLFEDFLEHEVLEARLLGGYRAPIDGLWRPLDDFAFERLDANSTRREAGHLPVVEENDAASVREQRWNIAGAQHLRVADADDQWRILLGDDDAVGFLARYNR